MDLATNKMRLSYHLHTYYISSNFFIQSACGKYMFSRAWRCITRDITEVNHRRLMEGNATARKIWTPDPQATTTAHA